LQTARQEYLDQLDVRPNTRLYYERNLNRLKDAKLSDITPREINRILDSLVQSSRNQALASFRAFFNWSIRRHYLERSPCERMELVTIPARSRLLTPSEIRALWEGGEQLGWPFGTLTRLALLLGQRRGELAALRWNWIDTENRLLNFPQEIMKGGKPHTIPYGDVTAQILAGIPNTGDLLFPARGKGVPLSGFSKFKTRLDKLSKVTGWTLHDCRRVLASGMAASGVPIHVIERYLSHTSGTLSGIVAVYQRHTWMPEMRLAVEVYERHLHTIIFAP
jgi:integrase